MPPTNMKVRRLHNSSFRKYNDSELAKRVGCGYQTIARERTRRGIENPFSGKYKSFAPEEIRSWRGTYQEIGDRLGLSRERIRQLKNKVGAGRSMSARVYIALFFGNRLGQETDSQIARDAGVSTGVVNDARRDLGIDFVENKIPELVKYYAEVKHLNDLEISERLDRTVSCISYVRSQYNIKGRYSDNKPSHYLIDWKNIGDDILRTNNDNNAAKILKISRHSCWRRRKYMDIPVPPKST